MILTRKQWMDEIKEFAPNMDWAKIDLPDSTYQTVTRKYVEEKYDPYWLKVKTVLRILSWRKKNQCNHFAKGAQFVAAVLHDKSDSEAESVAMAEFEYKIEKSGIFHEINIWRTEHGIEAYEPQNGKWLNLTQLERFSGRRASS